MPYSYVGAGNQFRVPSIISISSSALGFTFKSRYRLYEIDIIINRTLVYGTLTVVLGGIFETIDETLHYFLVTLAHLHSLPGSIIAALVVGALFDLVRHRIQRFANNHFPGGGIGKAGHPE